MDHWRRVLPADRFIEVEYEKLIADREAEIAAAGRLLRAGVEQFLSGAGAERTAGENAQFVAGAPAGLHNIG